MNSFIKLLYSLLIAVSLVMFVGFSIASVYEPPKPPDYSHPFKENVTPEDQERQHQEYEQQSKAYETAQKDYQRDVTYALLPISIAVLSIGIWMMRRDSEVVGEGLALGGVATSIYAVITSSMADARILRLVAVVILLAGTLLVAQQRFQDTLTPTAKTKARAKKKR